MAMFVTRVQLMAKYGPIMAAHVSLVQIESRLEGLEQQGNTQSKGRSGLVTYLSKTTIFLLIQIMKNTIQYKIGICHEVC